MTDYERAANLIYANSIGFKFEPDKKIGRAFNEKDADETFATFKSHFHYTELRKIKKEDVIDKIFDIIRNY